MNCFRNFFGANGEAINKLQVKVKMKLGCDLALEGGSAAPPGDAEINVAPPPSLPALVAFSEFGGTMCSWGGLRPLLSFSALRTDGQPGGSGLGGPWERKSQSGFRPDRFRRQDFVHVSSGSQVGGNKVGPGDHSGMRLAVKDRDENPTSCSCCAIASRLVK